MIKFFTLIFTLYFLTACSTVPTQPRNTENLCAIFKQKKGWYKASSETYKKWGVPIPVQMAIMYHESRFVADAEPSSGFFSWFNVNNAYGYPQAKDDTWDDYQHKTGHWLASRDNFADACDFIGWYLHTSNQKLGISKTDTRNLYLVYHEGLSGFKQQTYNQKPWLLTLSNKVAQKAKIFQEQLLTCQ